MSRLSISTLFLAPFFLAAVCIGWVSGFGSVVTACHPFKADLPAFPLITAALATAAILAFVAFAMRKLGLLAAYE